MHLNTKYSNTIKKAILKREREMRSEMRLDLLIMTSLKDKLI